MLQKMTILIKAAIVLYLTFIFIMSCVGHPPPQKNEHLREEHVSLNLSSFHLIRKNNTCTGPTYVIVNQNLFPHICRASRTILVAIYSGI